MDKYMSVITNFGCHYSCPYCIVKNNNLNIPKSTIEGLNNLTKEIENNNCNWVSISGGGDPLWEHEKHIEFSIENVEDVSSRKYVCTFSTLLLIITDVKTKYQCYNFFSNLINI